MIDLSIIVLSFNTKELLRECISSIEENKPSKYSYEVIVVDNASSDGSSEMVKKEFPNVTLVANKENLGYTKGNNLGVKKAKGRYILFLNADTLVYRGTLGEMVQFMDENKKVGAATCYVELPNGRMDDSCHRGFPTPWRSFAHFSGLGRVFPRSRLFAGYSMGWEDLSKIHEIESCSGAFMIVRREAGEEIGWWDEDFFWYGDDLDFCYRLRKEGWKVYFVPSVKILHYKGVSGGIKDISKHITQASRETRLRATHARFAAMRLFYDKHYRQKYPNWFRFLVMQGINLKHRITIKNL